MSKQEFAQARRSLAEFALSVHTQIDRYGHMGMQAIHVTGSTDPAAWHALLVDISKKIGAVPDSILTLDERNFTQLLLSLLAEGFDPRKDLRIAPRKVGHAPSKATLRMSVAFEVAARITEDGPRARTKAIRDVARLTGRTIEQVEKDWAFMLRCQKLGKRIRRKRRPLAK
jgi:hypothetical protein